MGPLLTNCYTRALMHVLENYEQIIFLYIFTAIWATVDGLRISHYFASCITEKKKKGKINYNNLIA